MKPLDKFVMIVLIVAGIVAFGCMVDFVYTLISLTPHS